MTLLINAVVGNSCFPIAPNPEDLEASPGLGPADAAHGLWSCAGATRVPSLSSGVVSLPDLPRNSYLPFFGGVQSDVPAKQQELLFSAASGRCHEHPRGRALTFSHRTRSLTLGSSLG